MGVNTLRISIMISLGSREEVVFILHVKRRDRGFTWSSFTLLLKNTQPTSKVNFLFRPCFFYCLITCYLEENISKRQDTSCFPCFNIQISFSLKWSFESWSQRRAQLISPLAPNRSIHTHFHHIIRA